MAAQAMNSKIRRFDLGQRIEHILLLVSFSILGITGLPQMIPDSALGNAMIIGMGGIEPVRIIHRVSAAVLMALTIYHAASVAYKVYVKRDRLSMAPVWKDATDAWQQFAHNLGWRDDAPEMPRYNFAEKMEYWAVVWGTVIMIITGFMLWNPIATTQFLPGQFVPAAKAAHGGEAILAVLAILTWHLYNVHIKYFNRSIFTGDMRREFMEEEHGAELALIETDEIPPAPPAASIRKRKLIFLPVAAIVTITLLIGLVWFVTFEDTAIETVPRQPVEEVAPVDGASAMQVP